MNRLSIAHLLLWTAGAAVVLALQGFHRLPTMFRSRLDLAFLSVASSLLAGAQLASLLLWAYRRIRRAGGFPTQPGHWLLIAPAMILLLARCEASVAMYFEFRLSDSSFYDWSQIVDRDLLNFAVLFGSFAATTLVAYVVVLIFLRGESRFWRLAIVCLVVQSAFGLLLWGVGLLSAVFGMTSDSEVQFMFAAAFGDLFFAGIGAALISKAAFADPRRKDRDFLHWTGIVVMLMSMVLGPVSSLYFLISPLRAI